jgi:hypothetical protein
MNERIHKLAEQAELQAYYEAQEGQIEKFAELIVRECAQFVEDKFDFIGDEIIVKEKMLEHFGVEE